jgi:guanylate kinase
LIERGTVTPFVFNVSGPYAVGKDTILNEIASKFGDRVYRVRTITTRPVSKAADPTYEQVSSDEFERRVSYGKWIANYQLSGRTAYGTSVEEIEEAAKAGCVSILSVYAGPDGAGSLRRVFGAGVVSIGLLATKGSAEAQRRILRERLLSRKRDDPAAIEARLKHQLQPLQYVIDNPKVRTSDGPMKVFDYVLINDDLDATVRHTVQLFGRIFFRGGE